jgi:hypothetical protein
MLACCAWLPDGSRRQAWDGGTWTATPESDIGDTEKRAPWGLERSAIGSGTHCKPSRPIHGLLLWCDCSLTQLPHHQA